MRHIKETMANHVSTDLELLNNPNSNKKISPNEDIQFAKNKSEFSEQLR